MDLRRFPSRCSSMRVLHRYYGGGHLKCAAREENYSMTRPVYLLNHNHANNKAASVELNLTL
jgi:hypothetical protein